MHRFSFPGVCFSVPHLRAGTKEKCAAVLGEKFRGLSRGLVPERQKRGKERKIRGERTIGKQPAENTDKVVASDMIQDCTPLSTY